MGAERAEALRREAPWRSDAQAEVHLVDSALDELPAAERRVLKLCYFEGYSYEEIAAELETSFSRVDHLIRKARARLARRIEVRRDRARIV